jgi:putative phage-type endonuclease
VGAIVLSPEQLALRKGGIAGSEVAAVCGLNNYQSPMQVYNEKLGMGDGFNGNEQTMIGEKLEAPIAEMAADRMDWSISKNDVTTVGHNPWEMATVDYYYRPRINGVICDNNFRILEIKNAGYRQVYSWGTLIEDPTSIPRYYWAQVVWQMYVTGIRKAHIAVLVGGRELRVFPVPWMDSQVYALSDCVDHFWNHHVQKKIPPTVESLASFHAGVSLLFPKRAKT